MKQLATPNLSFSFGKKGIYLSQNQNQQKYVFIKEQTNQSAIFDSLTPNKNQLK